MEFLWSSFKRVSCCHALMTAQWRLEDAYLKIEGMKDVKSKLSNSKEPPSKRERESEGALSTLFRRAKGKIGPPSPPSLLMHMHSRLLPDHRCNLEGFIW